jgi:uncharacterized protein YPO0396
MKDMGYSLGSIELLNWGNFHQLHEIKFSEPSPFGPLFSAPSASAILGVNGSGKSTLIDGLMMVLLPFEKSLKLGVTHDAEQGGSGGRTVKDYVLGKYSATGNMAINDLSEVFGRKDGISIFLVHFYHNQNPNKKITLGRAWWYQNYKVSDSQCAFMIHDHLKIQDFCENKIPPKNLKSMKEIAKVRKPHLVFFDTMATYFSSMSLAFGNITKDDLRILNNAFYVKSISQIDDFIRNNMLIQNESPHLERLLLNVKNGTEIAFAIESCENRIASIKKILKQILKIQDFFQEKQEIEINKKISSLFKTWALIQDYKKEFETHQQRQNDCQRALPEIETQLQIIINKLEHISDQLKKNDIDQILDSLGRQIRHLEEKLQYHLRDKEIFIRKMTLNQLQDLIKVTDPNELLIKLQQKKQAAQTTSLEISASINNLRFDKHQMQIRSEELRKDLDHLAKNQTFISKDLYEIKTRAVTELSLPESHLAFVGELIDIQQLYKTHVRAIESVLFPISRNLLCHPEHLNPLTKWLNKNGFQSDITVKRISAEELLEFKEKLNFDDNSILSMIEILSPKKTPFHFYLWRWLTDVFDFSIVETSELRTSQEKVVTQEGLVKSDARTMRKLKQKFQYSLGWNTEDEIQKLILELKSVQNQLLSVQNQILSTEQRLKLLEDQIRLCEEYSQNNLDFLKSSLMEAELKNIVDQKNEVLRKNPDYDLLKKSYRDLEQQKNEVIHHRASLTVKIEDARQKIEFLGKVIPQKEIELESSETFQHLIVIFKDTEQVHIQIAEFRKNITPQQSHISFDLELQNASLEIESKMNRLISTLTVDLNNFSREFHDPNLPYALYLDQRLVQFQQAWESALDRLEKTELPESKVKWQRFFDQVLIDSVKDTINEIRSQIAEVKQNITSINEVLQLTNYEELRDELRYLKIHFESSPDDRVRTFLRQIENVEKVLVPQIRLDKDQQSQTVMSILKPFVESLQLNPHDRSFVTDVRNHFVFQVHSMRRQPEHTDLLVEIFVGSKKDAKSSPQTTHLAYTLLASCLAYRFRFHDPVLGKDTPRLLILDEFGGKFDNEKPKEIIKLFEKMGFQSILVSPMSKGDLLAGAVSHMVFVFKVDAKHSKIQSLPVVSKESYEKFILEKSQ